MWLGVWDENRGHGAEIKVRVEIRSASEPPSHLDTPEALRVFASPIWHPNVDYASLQV
jgi:hypothetical protein